MQTTAAQSKAISMVGTIVGATLIFALIIITADKSLPSGLPMWKTIDAPLHLGPVPLTWTRLVHLLLGFPLFLYGAFQSQRATALKNSAEDHQRRVPTRLVETGEYARVRHPMYAAWMLSNTGIGFALQSSYGVGYMLLALVVLAFNGIIEERTQLIPLFGQAYLDYAQRVRARYFTPLTAAYVILLVVLSLAAFFV